MSHRRIETRLDLAAGDILPEGLSLAATLHVPDEPDADSPLLFLVPGGGYGRGYFDIRMAGYPGYSQAEYHAERGMFVIAIDHLGTGESSIADAIDLPIMAAAIDAATRIVVERIATGDLVVDLPALGPRIAIGAGQSMGGHIVAMAQADHGSFAGIAVLGASVTRTHLPMLPGKSRPPRDAARVEIIRSAQQDTDWAACFHWPDEPVALSGADMNPDTLAPWRSASAPACATRLLEPGIVAREVSAITVPVMLAYGAIDVTADPIADAAMFRSCPDVSMLILPRMAHMHNFAPTRHRLWERLHDFAHRTARDARSAED